MSNKIRRIITNIKKAIAGHRRLVIPSVLVASLLLVGISAWLVIWQNDTTDIHQNDQSPTEGLSGPELKRIGDFAGAAISYEQEANQTDEDKIKPSLYEQAGDSYSKSEQYDLAISAYQKAADAYRDIDDKESARRAETKVSLAQNDKLATEGAE